MIFYAGEVQHFIQLVFLFSLILIYSRCLKQQLALTLKEGKQAQQQNDFPRARCRYCTKLLTAANDKHPRKTITATFLLNLMNHKN